MARAVLALNGLFTLFFFKAKKHHPLISFAMTLSLFCHICWMLCGWGFQRPPAVQPGAWFYMRISRSLESMMGLSALPFQACMRNKRERKGLCIPEVNETEYSLEKFELLLSCDGYCITYYNHAFMWNILPCFNFWFSFIFILSNVFVLFISVATKRSLFLIQPVPFLFCFLFQLNGAILTWFIFCLWVFHSCYWGS